MKLDFFFEGTEFCRNDDYVCPDCDTSNSYRKIHITNLFQLLLIQVFEGGAVTITNYTPGDIQGYRTSEPSCDVQDSPFPASSTNLDQWTRTLTSLRSTILSCDDGYHLDGSADVSCDVNGGSFD